MVFVGSKIFLKVVVWLPKGRERALFQGGNLLSALDDGTMPSTHPCCDLDRRNGPELHLLDGQRRRHGLVMSFRTFASSASTSNGRKKAQTFLMSRCRYASPPWVSYSVACEKSMNTGCSSRLRMLNGERSAWTNPALWSFRMPSTTLVKNCPGFLGGASLSLGAMWSPEEMHSSTRTLFMNA